MIKQTWSKKWDFKEKIFILDCGITQKKTVFKILEFYWIHLITIQSKIKLKKN